MRIEILGSGGANTVPRPLCACEVCRQARSLGLPYSRTGPSVFVHGPDVLIDTPEEAKFQIERSRISNIQGALYSHWHPDHTAGRRLWESVNGDWRTWPPSRRVRRQTPIYLPETVADDFRTWMGLWDHLMFMQAEQRTVEVRVVRDDAAIEFGETTVTPIKLAESYVFAYLFETDSQRVLIAMDELNGWQPPDLGRLDIAVLPLGIFESDPFTGERRIHVEHPVLVSEATYSETLEIITALDARRVVLSHVEHGDGNSHDDLVRLGERDGWEPAFDTMILET
jgi:phosphoribosyl 1,2-cyclic phosphate phosphodiesterase